MTSFDALVVGGGPAGCAAAIRLRQCGLSVALAEARPGGFKIGESLPPAAKRCLAELGALSACEGALTCFGNQSAWGSPELHDTDFIRDPQGPGWHVDRQCFEARLRAIAVESGARLMGAWPASGQSISARLTLDCTGRNAVVAHSKGARRIHCDRLVGVAAVFEEANASAAQDRDSRTLVESVEAGWWYTALVPGGRRVAVFHSDPSLPWFRQARTARGFLKLLGETQHIHRRIADHPYRLLGRLRVFAANSSRLDEVMGDGWLAAGDAAAAFDPLSSQGIYTALYGGMQAADTVNRALRGERGAADRYRCVIGEVFRAYLGHLERYYAMESRWPGSIFWISRAFPRQGMYNNSHSQAVKY